MTESRLNPLDEIRKAIGNPFAMTDAEIEDFLARYDANEIDAPKIPSHLLPSSLAQAIAQGKTQAEVRQPLSFEQPALAARHGDEPLSEETLRQMMKAQDAEGS